MQSAEVREAGLKKKTCPGKRTSPAITTLGFTGEQFTLLPKMLQCLEKNLRMMQWDEQDPWFRSVTRNGKYGLLFFLKEWERGRQGRMWERNPWNLIGSSSGNKRGWKQSGCGCVGCKAGPRCQGALQRKPKPGNSVQGFQWLRFLCYFMTQDVKKCRLGKYCAVNFTRLSSLSVSVSWTWSICSKFYTV